MSFLDRTNFDDVYRLATATFPLDQDARTEFLMHECGQDQDLLDAVLKLLDRAERNLEAGDWEHFAALIQRELKQLAEEDPA